MHTHTVTLYTSQITHNHIPRNHLSHLRHCIKSHFTHTHTHIRTAQEVIILTMSTLWWEEESLSILNVIGMVVCVSGIALHVGIKAYYSRGELVGFVSTDLAIVCNSLINPVCTRPLF